MERIDPLIMSGTWLPFSLCRQQLSNARFCKRGRKGAGTRNNDTHRRSILKYHLGSESNAFPTDSHFVSESKTPTLQSQILLRQTPFPNTSRDAAASAA